jgi:DNA-binding MarR family transcriptional regulator
MSTPSPARSSADPEPSWPPLPIGALLRFGVHAIRERIYQGVLSAGFNDLRPAQVTLFRWPGPDGRRPSEVAADAQISKQRVNDLLRDLERLGYLRLERDPTDRRARIVRLTAPGRRLHRVAVGVHAQIEDEWRRTIGPRRYEHLREMLAELMGPRHDRDTPRPSSDRSRPNLRPRPR